MTLVLGHPADIALYLDALQQAHLKVRRTGTEETVERLLGAQWNYGRARV